MTFFCFTPTSKNNKYDFALSPRFRTWIVEVDHIFVSTCKISTIHRTISFRAQKFWNCSEILPRGESFQTSKSFVFRKFLRNFATKMKRNFFSIKTQKFPSLSREIFFFQNSDWSTSKFCSCLHFCNQNDSVLIQGFQTQVVQVKRVNKCGLCGLFWSSNGWSTCDIYYINGLEQIDYFSPQASRHPAKQRRFRLLGFHSHQKLLRAKL